MPAGVYASALLLCAALGGVDSEARRARSAPVPCCGGRWAVPSPCITAGPAPCRNILLTREGNAKIADVGFSRWANEQALQPC